MITRAEVTGMTCSHCVRAVFTALAGVPGITRADVKLGVIEVEHDSEATLDQIREAVRVAGYEVAGGSTNRRSLPLL